MKVHQLARGFWDHEPSLSLATTCKRFRPLAPKLQTNYSTSSTTTDTTTTTSTATVSSNFHLKSFILPQCPPPPPKQLLPSHHNKDSSPQVETQAGGTRWNPTQEQIGILEMLYRGGMRTPNANQIEQITAQLGRYGKIEGKNVFYWFQNHKARERQKQKRNNTLGLLTHSPPTPTITTTTTISLDARGEVERDRDGSPYKRKCRSWAFECLELEERKWCGDDEEGDRTLELFPLHPEGR